VALVYSSICVSAVAFQVMNALCTGYDRQAVESVALVVFCLVRRSQYRMGRKVASSPDSSSRLPGEGAVRCPDRGTFTTQADQLDPSCGITGQLGRPLLVR
jgi:hypothetical protein